MSGRTLILKFLLVQTTFEVVNSFEEFLFNDESDPDEGMVHVLILFTNRVSTGFLNRVFNRVPQQGFSTRFLNRVFNRVSQQGF